MLSASRILAVRRLSSRAVAKLIPQCGIVAFIQNIITSLPSSSSSVIHYNQLHGQLLQVYCLLKYLLSAEVERYIACILFGILWYLHVILSKCSIFVSVLLACV